MKFPQVCSGNITENFAIWEIANKKAPDKVKLVITPGLVRHAKLMQELRTWYRKPMNVSSWYRSQKFNSILPGSHKNSPHLRGMACDILLPGFTEQQYKNMATKWKSICENAGVIGGVTFYTWGMHFDSDSANTFGSKQFRIDDLRK